MNSQTRTRPSLDEIQTVIRSILEVKDEVYVLIDALDEILETQSRQTFMECISALFTSTAAQKTCLHILITSRLEKNYMFPAAKELSITAGSNEIKNMVEKRLFDPHFFRRSYMSEQLAQRVELKAYAVETISTQANAMFLAADLCLKSLVPLTNISEFKEALRKLPRGLDQLYKEAWDQILGQEDNLKRLAQRTICWLCFAPRQLTVGELRHALAVEIQDRDFDEDRLSGTADILNSCKGLVTMDKDRKIIRLVHSTTQQYFETCRKVIIEDAQIHLTQTCLTYLMFHPFEGAPCDFVSQWDVRQIDKARKEQRIAKRRFLCERMRQYPFLNYGAENWGLHACGKPEETCQDMIVQFLSSDNVRVNANMARFQPDSTIEYNDIKISVRKMTPLQIAISYNLQSISCHLITLIPHGDVNVRNRDVQIAFHWAAQRGQLKVVQAIYEARVSLAVPDGLSDSAVDRGIRYGHHEMVQCLLDLGENKSIQSETVNLAVKYDSIVLLRAYFHTLADAKTRISAANSILQSAFRNENTKMMQFALDNGGTIQTLDKNGDPIVFEAIRHGKSGILRFLVNHDVEKATKTTVGRSLLQVAAESEELFDDRYDILRNFYDENIENLSTKRLGARLRTRLEMHPDPNKLVNLPSFMDAIFEDSEHEEIINTLLEYGADIAECTRDGESLLHLSIASINRVRAFLQTWKGRSRGKLNVNVRDKKGRTPLHYAAAAGVPHVMRYLIEHGASVEAKDFQDVTTLHFAVKYPQCVQILLENECAVHVHDKYCRTPFHYVMLVEKTDDKVIGLLEATQELKSMSVDLQRKTASEYQEIKERHGYASREIQNMEDIYWLETMHNRYMLHRTQIMFHLREARRELERRARAIRKRKYFHQRKGWSTGARRTYRIVDDSEEEDFEFEFLQLRHSRTLIGDASSHPGEEEGPSLLFGRKMLDAMVR